MFARPSTRASLALTGSLLALALALALGDARAAEADGGACGASGRPWVEIRVEGASASFAAAMLGDLRAGLASTRIDACEKGAGEGGRALARVAVVAAKDEPLTFSIAVTDSVTLKRVSRDVNLAELPADGRALALAVATEELLRATWAELALRGVRKPPSAAPPEVRAALEPAASPIAPNALGARLSFEHYGGGQAHYGGDAFFLRTFGGWLGVELAAGARKGLTVSAPDGTISGSALAVDLSLAPALIRLPDFEIAALAGLHGARVSFAAEPDRQAVSRPASGFALYARGGFGFALGGAGSLRSHTRLGAGVPLRSFSASDAGRIATGVSDFEISASTGISLGF